MLPVMMRHIDETLHEVFGVGLDGKFTPCIETAGGKIDGL